MFPRQSIDRILFKRPLREGSTWLFVVKSLPTPGVIKGGWKFPARGNFDILHFKDELIYVQISKVLKNVLKNWQKTTSAFLLLKYYLLIFKYL